MVTFFPWCSIKKTFCSVVCFNNVVLEQRFTKRFSNVLFCVLCVRLCAVFSEQSIRLTRAVFFKVRSDSVTLWCIFITEYRALSCIPEKSRTRYFQKKNQISQQDIQSLSSLLACNEDPKFSLDRQVFLFLNYCSWVCKHTEMSSVFSPDYSFKTSVRSLQSFPKVSA